jgi:hypothetical protein
MKKKEKCAECKKRIATWNCTCGLKWCNDCCDNGNYCPADDDIDHYLKKIKPTPKKGKI